MRQFFAWVKRYERHLSALAMVAGFVVDNLSFGRVDVWQTQIVFAAYIAIASVSIAVLHRLETHVSRGGQRPRWRSVLPIATQFALGGMWSGFLIFYSRSADVSASWPFLLLLTAIFLGNEILSKYQDRLVFTTVLFFFGLYSYAIFAVPVFMGAMGDSIFLLSGAIAAGAFFVFLIVLRLLGNSRFLLGRWKIRGGALGILVLMNIFYFANILPPLPLALKSIGVYHAVVAADGGYTAQSEAEFIRFPWEVRVEHVVPGDSIYVFSSVFAPVRLTTAVVHRWEYFDAKAGKWVLANLVTFPIVGGRDGGYRGYSEKSSLVPGEWRVSVETPDGRVIGSVRFDVVDALSEPVLTQTSL